jgi:hypothetical protein
VTTDCLSGIDSSVLAFPVRTFARVPDKSNEPPEGGFERFAFGMSEGVKADIPSTSPNVRF